MKNFIIILVLLTGVCVGCQTQSTRPVKAVKGEMPDYTDRKLRSELRAEPIPFPADTPYETDSTLRSIYLKGFGRGWEVVVDNWLGGLIVVPSEFAHNESYESAWLAGYHAGVDAVVVRMEAGHSREK